MAVGSTRLIGIAPWTHLQRGSTNSYFSGRYGSSKIGIAIYDFWDLAANQTDSLIVVTGWKRNRTRIMIRNRFVDVSE